MDETAEDEIADPGSVEMSCWADKWWRVRRRYFKSDDGSWAEFRRFFGIPLDAVWWHTKTPELEAKLDAVLGPHGSTMFKAMQAVREHK